MIGIIIKGIIAITGLAYLIATLLLDLIIKLSSIVIAIVCDLILLLFPEDIYWQCMPHVKEFEELGFHWEWETWPYSYRIYNLFKTLLT